jgi:hypothetical protein
MSTEKLPEVIGSYRIQAKLGQGGMGAVFKGVHETLERPAAVKLLPPELAQNPEYVSRFLREARVIAGLRHDHIVQVYDAGAFEGRYFIAMELVDGTSLAAYLQEKNVLGEEEGVELFYQAAKGLAAAHSQGLVHRDIKPENLLLDKTHKVRIVDFGLVMESSSTTQLTATGACLGTPMYMSPEQADGEKADERSDLYSLGVTFYRALSGQVPFSSPTVMNLLFKHKFEAPPDPRKLRPELSESVANLLLSLMSKRREDRPQSAQQVVELIEGYRQGKKIPAPAPFISPLDGAKTQLGGPTSSALAVGGASRMVWLGIAAGALVLMVVGGVVAWVLLRGSPPTPGGKVEAGLKNDRKKPPDNIGGSKDTSRENPKDAAEAKRQELIESARTHEQNGDLALALAVYEKAAALGNADELQPKIAELKTKLGGGKTEVQPPPIPDVDRATLLAAQAKQADELLQYDVAALKYEEAAQKSGDAAKRQEYQRAAAASRRRSYLKQAQDAETRGDWSVAAAALSQALALEKDVALEAKRDELLQKAKQDEDFKTYAATGDRNLAAGQYVAARANYQLALRIKPGNAEVNAKFQETIGREAFARAEASRLAGNGAAARQDYLKALELYPPLRSSVEPRLAELDKQQGANLDVVVAQVDQQVRELHSAEAYATLVGALRANPQDARLLQMKAGLESLQGCEAVSRGLNPILVKGQTAAGDARRLDADDDVATRYQDGFATKARDCTEREAQVRARFLSHQYDAVKTTLVDAKTQALLASTDLQNAYERYAKKSKDAGEFKGVNIPFLKVGAKGDKDRADRYSRIADTFASLAQQARALSQ